MLARTLMKSWPAWKPPGMGGGMEAASAIFYGERTITGAAGVSLVAHETAHQWFGDSVTEKDWDDVWLSEGFATYFALLATEHYEGRDAFVAGLKRSRRGIFDAEKRLPGVAVVQDKPWKGIPNQIVYQKGAWALHMLRGQIGTEKFRAGIREYYRRFRDGNASTADLENVMEEAPASICAGSSGNGSIAPARPWSKGHGTTMPLRKESKSNWRRPRPASLIACPSRSGWRIVPERRLKSPPSR